jgi:hypothetical protein
VEKYGSAGEATDDNIIRRMRNTCRNVKQQYRYLVSISNIVLPRQQRLRERVSLLPLAYVACIISLAYEIYVLRYCAASNGCLMSDVSGQSGQGSNIQCIISWTF